MADLLQLPLNAKDFLRLAVVFLFAGIILLSFMYGTVISWLVKGESSKAQSSKEPTKIVGGLGILLVAIVADSTPIYMTSLFIGGLLIASERFMINLAAIFNSDHKSVHKISQGWTEANQSEVHQKQELEAEQQLVEESSKEVTDEKPRKAHAENTQKVEDIDNRISQLTSQKVHTIREAEVAVLQHFEEYARSKDLLMKKYVREGDKDGKLVRILDGVVLKPRSLSALFGVEVIYRQTLRPALLRISIRHAVSRMTPGNYPLVIAVAFSDQGEVTDMYLKNYADYIRKHYPGVYVTYYKYNEGHIEVVNESELEKI